MFTINEQLFVYTWCRQLIASAAASLTLACWSFSRRINALQTISQDINCKSSCRIFPRRKPINAKYIWHIQDSSHVLVSLCKRKHDAPPKWLTNKESCVTAYFWPLTFEKVQRPHNIKIKLFFKILNLKQNQQSNLKLMYMYIQKPSTKELF